MASGRRAALLAAAILLATACSTSSTDNDAAAETPPAELAITDILAAAEESAANNEALDSLCRRVYADAVADTELTIGLVTDVASIDDGTFNQAAFEGMEAAGRCFGVTTTFLESAGNDSEAQIAWLVNGDADIVITVGFQFQEATVAAAENRPDIRFIGVDQANPDNLPNYVAISFRDDQVGILAGTMAALLTETGTIAVIAGPDSVPPVVAIADGFEAGARAISPDIVVLRQHLDSFIDAPAGAQHAADFVRQGADVVFGAAGESGAGAIRTAAAAGAKVIGVDQDEYFTTFAGGAEPHADQIATSAIKRVDLGVFLTVAAMSTEQVKGGGFVLDAANGGVTYAPFHRADVPDAAAYRLEEVRLALAAEDDEVTAGG